MVGPLICELKSLAEHLSFIDKSVLSRDINRLAEILETWEIQTTDQLASFHKKVFTDSVVLADLLIAIEKAKRL